MEFRSATSLYVLIHPPPVYSPPPLPPPSYPLPPPPHSPPTPPYSPPPPPVYTYTPPPSPPPPYIYKPPPSPLPPTPYIYTFPPNHSTVPPFRSATSLHLPSLHSIPLRLDRYNYTLWQAQVLPTIRAHGFESFVTPTSMSPAPFLSSQSGAAPRPNPNYSTWIRHDQLLRNWMFASIGESLLSHVVWCPTARDVWITLERLSPIKSETRLFSLSKIAPAERLVVDENGLDVLFGKPPSFLEVPREKSPLPPPPPPLLPAATPPPPLPPILIKKSSTPAVASLSKPQRPKVETQFSSIQLIQNSAPPLPPSPGTQSSHVSASAPHEKTPSPPPLPAATPHEKTPPPDPPPPPLHAAAPPPPPTQASALG